MKSKHHIDIEEINILVLEIVRVGQFNPSKTHLGWPSGIGLGPRSVLLLKVSGSILSGANLRGLV